MTSGTTDRGTTPTSPPTTPALRPWVERIHALAARLATPLDDQARAQARGELWLLLSAALARSIRAQRVGLGPLSREDVEDLASTKAFDLLRGIEEGRIVLKDEAAHQVPAFLARIGRNAIIDLLRRERPRGSRTSDREEGTVDVTELARTLPGGTDVASSRVELEELARALDSCLDRLAPRARRIWIFRTLFEMSSREIAVHPDIRLKPEHVDVLVGRVRNAVRACLAKHGFEGDHVEATGIARLWDRIARGDGHAGAAK